MTERIYYNLHSEPGSWAGPISGTRSLWDEADSGRGRLLERRDVSFATLGEMFAGTVDGYVIRLNEVRQ